MPEISYRVPRTHGALLPGNTWSTLTPGVPQHGRRPTRPISMPLMLCPSQGPRVCARPGFIHVVDVDWLIVLHLPRVITSVLHLVLCSHLSLYFCILLLICFDMSIFFLDIHLHFLLIFFHYLFPYNGTRH
jgi:hypothetical protein